MPWAQHALKPLDAYVHRRQARRLAALGQQRHLERKALDRPKLLFQIRRLRLHIRQPRLHTWLLLLILLAALRRELLVVLVGAEHARRARAAQDGARTAPKHSQ